LTFTYMDAGQPGATSGMRKERFLQAAFTVRSRKALTDCRIDNS
jgi:hypothetical protein